MNFGDYWKTNPHHLPAFPLMQPRYDNDVNEGRLHMFWGAMRSGVTDSKDTEWWVQAGCNFNFVDSFCGGVYATALNVRLGRWQPTYASPQQREAFYAMPTLADLFPEWEQQAAMLDALPPILQTYPIQPAGSMMARLERLGAVSLGAKLLSLCGLYNRAFLGFWDVRTGSTRALMHWISNTLTGGVRAPETYEQFWYKRTRSTEPGRGVGSDRIYHNGYTSAWPKRLVTGLYMRNRNSGNDVAHSTIYVATQKPEYTSKRLECPHGAVHIDRARPTPELIERLVNGHFNVAPDHFYPM